MPVNPLSNSARSTQRGPLAGSLIRTRSFPHRFPIDSTTRKCWKAQKMMAGIRIPRSTEVSACRPRAISP